MADGGKRGRCHAWCSGCGRTVPRRARRQPRPPARRSAGRTPAPGAAWACAHLREKTARKA
ncbi:hypothetical protein AMB3_3286 [plant metagenome]